MKSQSLLARMACSVTEVSRHVLASVDDNWMEPKNETRGGSRRLILTIFVRLKHGAHRCKGTQISRGPPHCGGVNLFGILIGGGGCQKTKGKPGQILIGMLDGM